MNQYDIIGDIHGHADTLRALLAKLGYTERAGGYRHAERTAVFVGDFIDRGPKIRETLQIVRAMMDAGSALAVLGNHEWNALRYHTPGADGRPLREHTAKNAAQHRATLDQVAEPFPDEWRGWLAWFKTLPLYLDLGKLRVVHAAWCARSVAEVGTRSFADETFLHSTSQPQQPGHRALKTILAGPELDLPEGAIFLDKNGHRHRDIRVRWFGRHELAAATFRSLVFPPSDRVPDLAVPAESIQQIPDYRADEPPVIFGHYWMPPGEPRRLARNAACVDCSVALESGAGLLAAYRWSGESELRDGHFVVSKRSPNSHETKEEL